MSDWWPEQPDVPEEARASGEAPVRYEDVSQDGRLMLLALPHAISSVVWQQLIHHPLMSASRAGVVPILTRFVIEGGDGPFSVRFPLTADGCYQLAHTEKDGKVHHLLLNLWVEARAPLGRTHGPAPQGAGENAFAGRVFAEHVLTRPFAPPAERAVRTLAGVEGWTLSPVPAVRFAARPPDAALVLPPGATPLDTALSPDSAVTVFGLTHTDSNQHVNSLVYPRLFQESVLRRLAEHGRSTHVLARRLEVAYRKPCFAGDRVRFFLQAYVDGERVGAVGVLVADGQPEAKPYCYLHLSLAA